MAEWAPHHDKPLPPPPPPPPPEDSSCTPPTTSLDLSLPHRSGTYVVQVPKDQIYRVPPPENAEYVQRQGKNPRKSNCICGCCSGVICSIFVVVLLATAAAVAGYVILTPRVPSFSVEKVVVDEVRSTAASHHHSRLPTPNYQITLKSKNENTVMDMVYSARGGATLFYKRQNVGAGKTPVVTLDHGAARDLRLTLVGGNRALPPEIRKRIESHRKHVPVNLSLTMKIPVKLKLGSLGLWSRKMTVTCDLTVSTLAGGTRIKSQDCHVKLKS